MKWLIILLLLIPLASAATIEGDVYDFSFEKVQAVVTIDTVPEQKVVADGNYYFKAPPGTYTIKAEQYEYGSLIASTEDTIEITDQGSYTIDLILFPEVGIEDLYLIEPGLEEFTTNNAKDIGWIIIAILALIAAALLRFSKKKKVTPDLDSEAKKVLDFITKHKRTTQKEIRKEFPHSQAKISLILTELEDKGHIKKIKKGRGNVIIIN